MSTHDNDRQTDNRQRRTKMFGIAKVARVLGAHVFLQWFCIQKKFRTGKDIKKSRFFVRISAPLISIFFIPLIVTFGRN